MKELLGKQLNSLLNNNLTIISPFLTVGGVPLAFLLDFQETNGESPLCEASVNANAISLATSSFLVSTIGFKPCLAGET